MPPLEGIAETPLNLIDQRGATLIYAPDIRVYVESSGSSVLELSNDIVSFSLNRRTNSVSTFSCTINNNKKRYENKLFRMARIAVYLKGQSQWRQAFAGYLDKVPYRQITPGDVEISASCTLKRLKYTYWDPNSVAAITAFPWSGNAIYRNATILGTNEVSVGSSNLGGLNSSVFNGSIFPPLNPLPVLGSGFGPRTPPATAGGGQGSSNHKGQDISAPTGTPIYAAAGGRVSFAGSAGGAGNMTKIDHGGGIETRYLHQSVIEVSTGDQVSGGQRIGQVGTTGNSSGPHLHFEIRVNGEAIDPEPYLTGSSSALAVQAPTASPTSTFNVITPGDPVPTVSPDPDTAEDTVLDEGEYIRNAQAVAESDSGAALAIWQLLTDVVHWDPDHIHIQDIPQSFVENIGTLQSVGSVSDEVLEYVNNLLLGPQQTSGVAAGVAGGAAGVATASFGQYAFIADAVKQFFPPSEWVTAVAVALAESGGDPTVNNAGTNRDGSIDYGLFQINDRAHRDKIVAAGGIQALLDPVINTRIAFQVWNERPGNQKWRAWYAHTPYGASYGSGANYRRNLQAAQEAVGASTGGSGTGSSSIVSGVVGGAASGGINIPSSVANPLAIGSGGVAAANVSTFVDLCLAQNGDRYVWGAGRVGGDDPSAFDCSGLVFWACQQMGISFAGTAATQKEACEAAGSLISVDQGLSTRGALLFRINSGAVNHVAVSLGNGTVIEARGSAYGVGIFSTSGRVWTHAGWIPSLSTAGGSNLGTLAAGVGAGLLDPLSLQNPDRTISLETGASVDEAGQPLAEGSEGSFTTRSDGLVVGSSRSAFNIAWRSAATSTESIALEGTRAFLNDEPVLSSVTDLSSASLRDFMSAPNGDFLAFFPDKLGLYGNAPVTVIKDIEIIKFRIDLNDDMLKTHIGVSGNIDNVGDVSLPDWMNTEGIATIENRSLMALVMGVDPEDVFPQEFLNLFGMRTQRKAMPTIRIREWEVLASIHEFMTAWSEQFISSVEVAYLPEIMPGMRIQLDNHDLRFYVEAVSHSGSRTGGFTTMLTISSPTDSNDRLLGVELTSGPDIAVEIMRRTQDSEVGSVSNNPVETEEGAFFTPEELGLSPGNIFAPRIPVPQ